MDDAALLQRIYPGAMFRRAWSLTGGVSTAITAVEGQWQGQTQRLVVRRYSARALNANPQVAQQEFNVLSFIHRAGLNVPRPLCQQEGVLVSTFIAGENGEGYVDPSQLAGFLSELHLLDASRLPLEPLVEVPPASKRPDDTLWESRIRDALRDLGTPTAQRAALLHGDFWPGNTIWQEGKLVGVIDWEDAAQGDPLSDVGNARLELFFFHGPQVMQSFTDEYMRLTGAGRTSLPYWDLRAALRPCGRMQDWGLAPAAETRLRERHAQFVQGALQQLGMT